MSIDHLNERMIGRRFRIKTRAGFGSDKYGEERMSDREYRVRKVYPYMVSCTYSVNEDTPLLTGFSIGTLIEQGILEQYGNVIIPTNKIY